MPSWAPWWVVPYMFFHFSSYKRGEQSKHRVLKEFTLKNTNKHKQKQNQKQTNKKPFGIHITTSHTTNWMLAIPTVWEECYSESYIAGLSGKKVSAPHLIWTLPLSVEKKKKTKQTLQHLSTWAGVVTTIIPWIFAS